MDFDFTTREEYLKWKANWKEDYFDTIAQIRTAALARRDTERAFSKTADGSKEYWAAWDVMGKARSKHRLLKEKATLLLRERALSKIQAGEQREARLNKIA